MASELNLSLLELLHCFASPCHFLGKPRTSYPMGSCFVEVRKRTRPMIVFTNIGNLDLIFCTIFKRLNEGWKSLTLQPFTQAASRCLPASDSATVALPRQPIVFERQTRYKFPRA